MNLVKASMAPSLSRGWSSFGPKMFGKYLMKGKGNKKAIILVAHPFVFGRKAEIEGWKMTALRKRKMQGKMLYLPSYRADMLLNVLYTIWAYEA